MCHHHQPGVERDGGRGEWCWKYTPGHGSKSEECRGGEGAAASAAPEQWLGNPASERDDSIPAYSFDPLIQKIINSINENGRDLHFEKGLENLMTTMIRF